MEQIIKCLECGKRMIIDAWIDPQWDGLCGDCREKIKQIEQSIKDWNYIERLT